MSIVAQKKPSNDPTFLSENKTISVNRVTDIDGNVYKTVKIGTQSWMVENLKTTKYRNGNSIPNVTEGSQWSNLTTGAYCDYNNTVSNSIAYGRLYNWNAVSDSRNIAPTGWHVATDYEWTTLTTYLGGEGVAGGKLKESGTTHWSSPNTSATNESGFSALPGGYRYNSGDFNLLGSYGMWWSSTQNSTSGGWTRSMGNTFSMVGRYEPGFAKSYGFSVRCIRDPLIVNAGTDKSLFCENIVQLDSVTTNFTGLGTLKYKWYPSEGLNNDSIPNPIATVTKNTTYTVTVALPDGYSEQDSVQVFIKSLTANAGTDKATVCGGTVQLGLVTSNYTGSGILKYKWTPSNGLNNDSISNPLATVTDNSTYTVTVTTPNGCTAGDNVQVTVNPLTSNAGADKALVCGGSVQLGLVTTNYTGSGILKYKWTPSNGLNNDSISNPIATVTDNLTYTLTVTTPNGCTASDIVQVTVNPLIANAGIDKTFVCGTTSQLEVSTNYTGTGRLSYKWVPSEGLSSDTLKNPIVHSFKTMSYTVTITTPNGCIATDIVKVQPSVSLSQKIRLVGVDSNNKNTIVWNVLNPDIVDSVNIYKESDITDVFNKIGLAPYSGNFYVDSLSNPKEKSNRYKITLRDKCGFETQASEPHKTMHLTINQGQNNSWNLILEPYDGFVVSTYKIYRGTSPESLYLLSSMAGSSYQFSDYNPPLGFVYYQVEVIAPSTQLINAPSQLRSENVVNVTNLTSSRSNIATNNTTGVNRLNPNINFFTISQNPAKEVVILALDNISQSTVKIYDMVGRMIKLESVSGLLNYINISNLPNALYVLEVRSGNKIGRQKLLIKNGE